MKNDHQPLDSQGRMPLQELIGNTLRWGVTIACTIAAIGGIIYLCRHGNEPLPDYTVFDYSTAKSETDYTTLSGIWQGVTTGHGRSFIQLGVLALILTPITRVVLSLFDFLQERDWLYSAITAVVLAVIISNSIGGM